MTKHIRENYIPKNAIKIAAKNCSAVCYLDTSGKMPIVVAFQAKRQKPSNNYRFPKGVDQAHKFIKQFIEEVAESEKVKAEWAAKTKQRAEDAKNSYNVGDILYSSWGYDQTNVDFYQVIDRTAATVTLAKISQNIVSQEKTYEHVAPIAGDIVGKTFRAKISGYGVKVGYNNWANKWDGTPKHQTSWGFGH